MNDSQGISTEYFKLIDKIIAHFAGSEFTKELATAKADFFDNAGILEEQTDQYEQRMAQFYDWYFFTRELSGFGRTPLESAFMTRDLRFSPEEIILIDKMKKHTHSIFEFIKVKNSDVYVKDLLKNKKMVIKGSPWTFGFEVDQLFEARVVPHEDNFVFMRGFCFHPADVKKFILKEIKRHRKDPDLDPEVMILKLLRMRYKAERYRFVSAEKIYLNEVERG